MKQVISLMMCLLMMVSMVACGRQTGTTDENNVTTEQNETMTPATEESAQPEQTTEHSEPAETEIIETEPAFDKSWAGDQYVMPIPKPPFEEFEISGDEHEYQLISTNENEITELTRQDIIDYCKVLQDLGFTIDMQEAEISEGTDTGYEFEATNADGVYCYIAFMEARQMVYILIKQDYSALENTSATQNEENEDSNKDEQTSDNNEAPTKVDLPDLGWDCEEIEEANGNKYLSYSVEDVSLDVIEDYVEKLASAGYVMTDNSTDGNWTFWSFSNEETGAGMHIGYHTKLSKCQIDIFGDF